MSGSQSYDFNIRDYWNIFIKRKTLIISSFLIVFLSIFAYVNMQTPIYMASVMIKVERTPLPSSIVFPSRQIFIPETIKLSDYLNQLTSSPIIKQAARRLNLITDDMPDTKANEIVNDIRNSVTSSIVENSNMLILKVESSNPRRAANMANTIAKVFKVVNRDQKNHMTYEVRVFVEKSLAEVGATLKNLEERSRVLTIQGAIGSGVNIINKISELEKERSGLLTKFTEIHPDVIAVDEEIADLKKELKNLPKEEFEYGVCKRDIATMETLYESLTTKLYEARIREAEKIDNVVLINPATPPKNPIYPNKTKSYITAVVLGIMLGITIALLTEHMDTSIGRVDDIESFIKVSVLGVIPYCEEEKGLQPKKTKKWGGLFSIRKKETRKDWSGLRMFAFEEKSHSSIFLEAFRILSINLQVTFGKGEKIKDKAILVTSCNPEEGKTMISTHISVVLCQLGYKVLIIDADTRRANVHKIFGIPKKEDGLTDVLTGKLDPDKAVRTVTDLLLGSLGLHKIIDKPWINNINIVTSGSVFPNPVNLFNSAKMSETLKYYKSKYDIVIIDSSPILAVSEPSIIIPKTDGVLLVYRSGYTSRLALRRAKAQIDSISNKDMITGVVLNNVTPEIGIDTYYYYSKRYYKSDDDDDEVAPQFAAQKGGIKNV